MALFAWVRVTAGTGGRQAVFSRWLRRGCVDLRRDGIFCDMT